MERFCIGIMQDNSIVALPKMHASMNDVYNSVLGNYSTREKALKVLDMIEEAYKDASIMSLRGNMSCRVFPINTVFQMPKDDEV
jgi:hypothetical protein